MAVVQSSFLPWLGYFDLIKSVDHFIFLEDVQYTNRDWRNRNRIKTPNGPAWITVPVRAGDRGSLTLREAETVSDSWPAKLLRTLERNYGRTPYFDTVFPLLEPQILEGQGNSLSSINRELILNISDFLGLKTSFSDDAEIPKNSNPSERLAQLVGKIGGDTYLSGPSASNYLDEIVFRELEIEVRFVNYPDVYGPYAQLWGPFVPNLSIIDSLFNLGPGALDMLKGELGQ